MTTLTVANLIELFREMTDEERQEIHEILHCPNKGGRIHSQFYDRSSPLATFYRDVIEQLPIGKWYLTCDAYDGRIEAWVGELNSKPTPMRAAEWWGAAVGGSPPIREFRQSVEVRFDTVSLNGVTVDWADSLFYVDKQS